MPLRIRQKFLNDDIAGIAILNECVIAPRKMRLIADLIRNESVENAFAILSCKQKKCVDLFKKLLLSAVSNCEKKCEKLGHNICSANDLYVSKIFVDNSGMLKRTLPAPHGRAFIVRKRNSHVLVEVKIKNLQNNNDKKKVKKENLELKNSNNNKNGTES